MPKQYDIRDWYWQVAGSSTQVYSSARATYVPTSDAAYEAFLAAGGFATAIDTEANLIGVFAAFPAGHKKSAALSSLAALDVKIPRGLEDYLAAAGFDTTKLPPATQATLAAKVAARGVIAGS